MNKNKLLHRNHAIYISNNFIMKKETFKTHYNNFLLNHFARV